MAKEKKTPMDDPERIVYERDDIRNTEETNARCGKDEE
jgi:hypothetical protein